MRNLAKANRRRRAAEGSKPRGRLSAILFAWLLATGAHWDCVQVVAWTRMMFENAQAMPIEAAVARTFAVEGMCGACRLVETAKRDADGASAVAGQLVEKAPLVLQPASGWSLTPPDAIPLALVAWAVPPTWRDAPPVPPPRVG